MTKVDAGNEEAQGNILSNGIELEHTSENEFNRLQEQHDVLIVSLQNDNQDVDLDAVWHNLEALSAFGSRVSEPERRSLLRGYIRFWASYIHDRTGEYPVINLRPSERLISEPLSQNRAEISGDTSSPSRFVDGYELIEQIGRGGFSTVYLARETSTDNRFAIKIFEKRELEEKSFKEMLKREALATHLQHPNILVIRKLGFTRNVSYIVTDYIAAGSLAERLNQYYWRPQLSEVLSIFKQIASALNYLQSQRIIHRDVKPGNILIDYDNNCYLGDFGVATLIEQLYGSAMVVGTPQYMAPEIIRSPELASDKTDIYSFGVVMYQILSGRLPFDGETAQEWMQAHLEATPHPMTSEIPHSIAEMVNTCLAKDPHARVSADQLHSLIVEIESALSEDQLKWRISGYTSPVNERHQVPYASVYETSKYYNVTPRTEVYDSDKIQMGVTPLDVTPYQMDKPNKREMQMGSIQEVQDTLIISESTATDTQYSDLDEQTPEQLPVALLMPLNGHDRGKLIPVKNRAVIGRSPLCDIVLNDLAVSQQHLLLVSSSDDSFIWNIYDLASNNGTLIDDKPITISLLNHNSKITIGTTRLVFKRLDIDIPDDTVNTSVV